MLEEFVGLSFMTLSTLIREVFFYAHHLPVNQPYIFLIGQSWRRPSGYPFNGPPIWIPNPSDSLWTLCFISSVNKLRRSSQYPRRTILFRCWLCFPTARTYTLSYRLWWSTKLLEWFCRIWVGWILDLDGCIRRLHDATITTLKNIPSLLIEINIFQQRRQDNNVVVVVRKTNLSKS